MHLAFSTIHLTLLSCNIIALFDAISVISFSPIFATRFGSNSQNASLVYQMIKTPINDYMYNVTKYEYLWGILPKEFFAFYNLSPIIVH